MTHPLQGNTAKQRQGSVSVHLSTSSTPAGKCLSTLEENDLHFEHRLLAERMATISRTAAETERDRGSTRWRTDRNRSDLHSGTDIRMIRSSPPCPSDSDDCSSVESDEWNSLTGFMQWSPLISRGRWHSFIRTQRAIRSNVTRMTIYSISPINSDQEKRERWRDPWQQWSVDEEIKMGIAFAENIDEDERSPSSSSSTLSFASISKERRGRRFPRVRLSLSILFESAFRIRDNQKCNTFSQWLFLPDLFSQRDQRWRLIEKTSTGDEVQIKREMPHTLPWKRVGNGLFPQNSSHNEGIEQRRKKSLARMVSRTSRNASMRTVPFIAEMMSREGTSSFATAPIAFSSTFQAIEEIQRALKPIPAI